MSRALAGAVVMAACSYPPLERVCTSQAGPGCLDAASDASCPGLHYTGSTIPPSVELLIDRSASMANNFNDQPPMGSDPVKYAVLESALVSATGIVQQFAGQVYFGAALFPGTSCPGLISVPRALNNAAAISNLLATHTPSGNTPTPVSIDAVVADFQSNPLPNGSQPVIVLATDGLPSECAGTSPAAQAESVAAAANAFARGIRLIVLSVGNTAGTATHFQALANAGQGVQPGQPDAPYYAATSPGGLSSAVESIIGTLFSSCDLVLSSRVDPTAGPTGHVTLNNMDLAYGTDWTLDLDGMTIHLLGNACTTLKQTRAPVVDATFPCSAH